MASFRKIKKGMRKSLKSWACFFDENRPPFETDYLKTAEGNRKLFESWGVYEGERDCKIMLASGMGYGNVGDEAQMGASLGRWKRLLPCAQLEVLTPSPAYTRHIHQVESLWAPRVVWFHSNTESTYFKSKLPFKLRFLRTWIRLTLTARFMRSGLPIAFANEYEMELLSKLYRADALHISGGGFLTGMTMSRLWENALLMRLCQLLETPYFLTGQTLGVFRSRWDRWLARKSLMQADYIYLRDSGLSEAELKTIGVQGDHVKSTFDDALFFDSLDEERTRMLLSVNGIDADRPYAIMNFHYWGQSEEIRARSCQRFAELSDYLTEQYSLQLLFVSMTPSDEAAEDDVIARMQHGDHARRLNYQYDYREARATYQFARMVFTMKHHPIIFAYGEGVPVVSVALDDYYYHKNKGAMDNCGHGRYCLDQSTFYSDQARVSFDVFFDEYDSLKEELNLWLSEAREIETEPMERFIERRGLGKS